MKQGSFLRRDAGSWASGKDPFGQRYLSYKLRTKKPQDRTVRCEEIISIAVR